MKRFNLIELNEVNFHIVKKYVQERPGYYQGFEKLLNLTSFNTSSEESYDQIEPWIQWPSVHTCKTYAQHKIFRLGDIVNYTGEQIFEKIERAGYFVGCVSPMNASNKLKNPAYFIPDPWTNTACDSSFTSRIVHLAIKQAVNDNSEGKINISTYIALGWILLTKTQIKNWPTYAKLFLKRKKRWNKALFLDLLLTDLFINLKKKKKDNFSCLFLNAFAHVQHHYLLNSKMYKGDLRNSSDYISQKDDPILDTIKLYNKIIFDLLEKFDEKFLFATGLRQIPVEKKIVYYRLKRHKVFLANLGIRDFEIETRMTRDFLIKFKNDNAYNDGLNILSNINYKGQRLFGEIEERKMSLFVTLTYSELVNNDDTLIFNNKKLSLSNEFVFVAIKNAYHDQLGYVFTNFQPHRLKSGIHVSNVGEEILKYFGI